jgi:hypothetical protein
MPNRIIREAARTSPTLDALSDGAERMFWQLTTVADDFGRFEADPRVLLAQCFPLKVGVLSVAQVQQWYAEMEQGTLVQTYQQNGHCYGFFVTWTKYQRQRAQESKFPPPPANPTETRPRSSDNIRGHPRSSAAEESRRRGVEESRNRGVGSRGGRGRRRAMTATTEAGTTTTASTPGELSEKLQTAIRAMQVQGFHGLANPTQSNERFWNAQLEVIEAHEGVSVFACLRDVDAYYASRPDEWPRDAKEAARRMKAALEVAVKKILEAQQRPQRKRKYA